MIVPWRLRPVCPRAALRAAAGPERVAGFSVIVVGAGMGGLNAAGAVLPGLQDCVWRLEGLPVLGVTLMSQ